MPEQRIDYSALFDLATHDPELEEDRVFLEDQSGPRRMKMGGVDRSTTERWQRREARKTADAQKQSHRSPTTGEHSVKSNAHFRSFFDRLEGDTGVK